MTREPVTFKELVFLLAGTPNPAAKHIEHLPVLGLSCDSRKTKEGDLFFAVEGAVKDGHEFIAEAKKKGARAILASRETNDKDFPVIQVASVREALPQAADAFYHSPTRRLKMIGVTGTNGKTTTVNLLQHIFNSMGQKCGRIGTIDYDTTARIIESKNTTPGPLDLQSLFAEMADAGAKAAVMEVSSHALDQHRVDYIEFDGAVFTNITQDHLDYHLTLDNYREAKALLLTHLKRSPHYPHKVKIGESSEVLLTREIEGAVAINADCPECRKLLDRCPPGTIRFGMTDKAELRGENIRTTLHDTSFEIVYDRKRYPITTPLVGTHNAYNLISAVAILTKMNYPVQEVVRHAATFRPVRGRLEPVLREGDPKLPFQVLVDYAHTTDALTNVLSAIRPLAKGRLTVIFGCGGDRDRTKRPMMARATEKFADRIIVTSDNPRTEDPAAIIREVMAGFHHPERVTAITDRKEAIRAGIRELTNDAILLIAGKGHETYQIFRDRTIDFDDVAVAREILGEQGYLK